MYMGMYNIKFSQHKYSLKFINNHKLTTILIAVHDNMDTVIFIFFC